MSNKLPYKIKSKTSED